MNIKRAPSYSLSHFLDHCAGYHDYESSTGPLQGRGSPFPHRNSNVLALVSS